MVQSSQHQNECAFPLLGFTLNGTVIDVGLQKKVPLLKRNFFAFKIVGQ